MCIKCMIRLTISLYVTINWSGSYVNKSAHLLPLSLKSPQRATLRGFLSSNAISFAACIVNPLPNDLLRRHRVHGNTRRTASLAVHTATKLTQRDSTNQGAPKVTRGGGPGQVFLCSLSLWLLRLVLLKDKKTWR